jgi:hypothetical protein
MRNNSKIIFINAELLNIVLITTPTREIKLVKHYLTIDLFSK